MSGFKVLAISGSLRKGSFNTLTLHAMQDVAPEGMEFTYAEIGDIPLYNDDVRLAGYPVQAQRFRAQVAAADGIVIATPEYNYSVSSALKNAIDWASRPPDQPFNNKPCALISASGGPTGGIRAQFHLRHILVALNAFPVNNPHVIVAGAPDKFDANGKFTDPVGKELMRQLLDNLVKWAKVLKA